MEWEENTLINQLTQGKELAEQLRNYLHSPSSLESRRFVIDKILSCYEKLLSILNWDALGFEVQVQPTLSESQHSFPKYTTSPRSDVFDQVQDQKNVFKKRKTQERFTEQMDVEGPLDDGYSWRKYGQKKINGTHFPRGYYRCSHRDSQGCLSTKQVQRSDVDPSVFDVTYRGRHTCVRNSHFVMGKQSQDHPQQHYEEKLKPTEEKFLKMGEELREEIFPSFSFTDASTPPCNVDRFGFGYDVQPAESELTDLVSAPTSVAELDIFNFDFDTNFSLDDYLSEN